jgi:hypothetical protein
VCVHIYIYIYICLIWKLELSQISVGLILNVLNSDWGSQFRLTVRKFTSKKKKGSPYASIVSKWREATHAGPSALCSTHLKLWCLSINLMSHNFLLTALFSVPLTNSQRNVNIPSSTCNPLPQESNISVRRYYRRYYRPLKHPARRANFAPSDYDPLTVLKQYLGSHTLKDV